MLTGQPDEMQPRRYAPATPWPIGKAALAVLAAIAASFVAGMLPVLAMPGEGEGRLGTGAIIATVALSQLVMGAAGWWFAGWLGGRRGEVLALGPMQVSMRAAALAILGMFAVTSGYQAFRYVVLGHDVLADTLTMAPLFGSPYWPLTLVVVVLIAPLAEEVLFRGFLLSAFARTDRLFWVGMLVSTVIWTALHSQYGWPALLLVAIMGVIFSLMLRWSGSLRLPIVAHVLNNAVSSGFLLYHLDRLETVTR